VREVLHDPLKPFAGISRTAARAERLGHSELARRTPLVLLVDPGFAFVRRQSGQSLGGCLTFGGSRSQKLADRVRILLLILAVFGQSGPPIPRGGEIPPFALRGDALMTLLLKPSEGLSLCDGPTADRRRTASRPSPRFEDRRPRSRSRQDHCESAAPRYLTPSSGHGLSPSRGVPDSRPGVK
jgi:hypothetical protein